MQTIDLDKWKTAATPQPAERPWCYAAVLTSISKYLIDTQISMPDFVELAFGDRDSVQRPEWEKYMEIATKLTTTGLEYSRTGAGRRVLIYDMDCQDGVPDVLIQSEIQARRPVICTILGGAHDVVIVGVEFEKDKITRILYWNPSDGGTGNLSKTTFVDELKPICVFTVNILREQIVSDTL